MFEIWFLLINDPHCLKVEGLERARFAWDTLNQYFDMMSARP